MPLYAHDQRETFVDQILILPLKKKVLSSKHKNTRIFVRLELEEIEPWKNCEVKNLYNNKIVLLIIIFTASHIFTFFVHENHVLRAMSWLIRIKWFQIATTRLHILYIIYIMYVCIMLFNFFTSKMRINIECRVWPKIYRWCSSKRLDQMIK